MARTIWILAMVAVSSGALSSCHRAGVGASSPRTGCGAEIPASALWTERTRAELDAGIERATACARVRRTRVLLEFVATWCDDCQAMTRIEQAPPVSTVLRERYERVRVNVGQWDEASAALRARYGIDRIAAYVVLDPADGRRIAQRVVEPVTGGTRVTPESWAAWLRDPR